jgi:N-hydroxyarylamine O-acetyltransferase
MLDLDAYFRRIGYAGDAKPSLATLRELHLKHPLAIAFENLDSLAGRAVRLDSEALERKLVERRRGGYCFEHNLLLTDALRAIGFDPVALVARVVWDRGDDGMRPRTHMLLLLELPEGRYIADVGFGGLTLTAPLALDAHGVQPTPHEGFRIVRDGTVYAVEAQVGGAAKTLYRFDLQPQRRIDIEVLNHFVATHPSSPFLVSLMAARAAPDGRYALRDNRLTARRAGAVEQREIGTAAELRQVLVEVFGIEVPDAPDVDAALGRITGSAR